MSSPSAEPVGASEQSKALAALVSAFIIDPVMRWLFPTSEAYLTHFPVFAAAFGGKAFATETAWRLGEFSAVAFWLPPGAEPDEDTVVAVLSESLSPSKQGESFAVLEQMEVAHPKYAHWYLPWLGVDSAVQGRGLGTQLMNPCLATVDEDHLPAFLETPNPRNISFYERHGFEVTAVSQAGTCPPVTSMLRAAR
jgi:ribosomal protein S18 acetylase RimI-like enzyme